MANLTVTVDGDVLRRAQIRALEIGTSVNAVFPLHFGSAPLLPGGSPGATTSIGHPPAGKRVPPQAGLALDH